MNLEIILKPCLAHEQIDQLQEAIENLINTQYKGVVKSVEWGDGDASQTLKIVKNTMNALEITGITTDHMGSLHLKVKSIMDVIYLQVTALEINNQKPKFIIMSVDIYERICYELTNYHQCPTHPAEYMEMHIVIDTYADPTTLRVLPEVHKYG